MASPAWTSPRAPGYEDCDDGNGFNGDACLNSCRAILRRQVRRLDVKRARHEECDDGNNVEDDGCDTGAGAVCGNGRVDPGEQCDDGNRVMGAAACSLSDRSLRRRCSAPRRGAMR